MICAICHAAASGPTCSSCGGDTLLNGRYRLEAVLGEGGAGTTFRANDARTREDVAVKELSVRRIDSIKTLELFEREARTLERLEHPDIPAYLADFVVERPGQVCFYLVQELVDGANLQSGAPMPEREVLEVVARLCDILVDLHGRRPPFIHRDIKPSNIMRRGDGRLALIDFGSVRRALEDSIVGGSTVAGTFGYMAPEQLRGHATPASDLYAVGATAVALLTGRDAAELVDPIRPTAWRDAVDARDDVIDLLGRLLEPDDTRRLGDASEAARRARALLKYPSEEAETRRRVEPPPRVPRERATPDDDRLRKQMARELRRQRGWEHWGTTSWAAAVLMGLVAALPLGVLGGTIIGALDEGVPFAWRLAPAWIGVPLWTAHVVYQRGFAQRKNPWRQGALRAALVRSWGVSEQEVAMRAAIRERDVKYLARRLDRFVTRPLAPWPAGSPKAIPLFEARAWGLLHGGRRVAAAEALDEALARGEAAFGADSALHLSQLRQYAPVRATAADYLSRALDERRRAEGGLARLAERRRMTVDEVLAAEVRALEEQLGCDGATRDVAAEVAAVELRRAVRREWFLRWLPRLGDGLTYLRLGLVTFAPAVVLGMAAFSIATCDNPRDSDGAALVPGLVFGGALIGLQVVVGAVLHHLWGRGDWRRELFADFDAIWPPGADQRPRFIEVVEAVWGSPSGPLEPARRAFRELRVEGLGDARRTQVLELGVLVAQDLPELLEAVERLDHHAARDARTRATVLRWAAVRAAREGASAVAQRWMARALALRAR